MFRRLRFVACALFGVAWLAYAGQQVIQSAPPDFASELVEPFHGIPDPSLRPESLLTLDGESEPIDAGSSEYCSYVPNRWLDQNYGLLFEGDPYPPGTNPLLERPGLPVGWFAGVELTAVAPHLLSQINSGNSLSGTFSSPVQLPVANIDWSVMPQFQVGYRRPNGVGEYIASYRFVLSQGSDVIAGFDSAGPGRLDTNLNVQVLDLDYAFTDYIEEPAWWVPYLVTRRLGVRVAGVISESRAFGQQILDERAKNTFIGAGPRTRFDMQWPIASSPVNFFSGIDLSGVVGPSTQRFSERAIISNSILSAAGRTGGNTTGVAVLGVQAGLNWIPSWREGMVRFSAGYQWERWWFLGDDNGNVELTLQGPFIRGELRF